MHVAELVGHKGRVFLFLASFRDLFFSEKRKNTAKTQKYNKLKTGMRQGDSLSSLLFNPVMDRIIDAAEWSPRLYDGRGRN
jgi:hypothetical protein